MLKELVLAAATVVSGDITRLTEEPIVYGDSVSYEVNISGKLSKNSRVYITTVCGQDGLIVYQSSNWSDYTFIMEDQTGQGLEWDGSEANCSANLMYRVKKGKGYIIEILDQDSFIVNP